MKLRFLQKHEFSLKSLVGLACTCQANISKHVVENVPYYQCFVLVYLTFIRSLFTAALPPKLES